VTRWSNRLARRSQYNPSPVLDSPWLSDSLRSLARRRVERLVPARIAEQRDDAMRRAVAETVGDRYRESNRITAGLTGLDLARYGWAV
jgi:hypothetical protein